MTGAKGSIDGYQHPIHRSTIMRHARNDKQRLAHGSLKASSLLFGKQTQIYFSGSTEFLGVVKRF
jgi:hypothetical protein